MKTEMARKTGKQNIYTVVKNVNYNFLKASSKKEGMTMTAMHDKILDYARRNKLALFEAKTRKVASDKKTTK